ncbi:hypothetical protein [Gryllotalpicola koreensis]|uniref:Uncharacterized protein n=1 Tax=Gryllotalpicola koreensis TaxID=993086 RepID=A0ABP8A6C4_9MICO
MTLRKYALSPRVYASALAVLPVVRATRKPALGQRSWALWAAWGLGMAVTLITVREDSARRVSTNRP